MTDEKPPQWHNAAKKRRRQGDETRAAKLRESDYLVMSPELLERLAGQPDVFILRFIRNYHDCFTNWTGEP